MNVRIMFDDDGGNVQDVEVLRVPTVGEVVTLDQKDGPESWKVERVEHYVDPARVALYVKQIPEEREGYAPIRVPSPWG